MFVKICGLTNAEDTEAVMDLAPDAVGFIFWPQSRRYVIPAETAEWGRAAGPRILRVGVFVNETRDMIQKAAEAAELDVIQCHGTESPEFCASLGMPVWKALNLVDGLPAPASDYDVDCFLVDGYSREAPGGTGVTADWDLAGDFVATAHRPVILAGGLVAATLPRAFEKVSPWGVDVSSGVESSPGRKDLEKVKQFIQTCRNYDETS